MINVNHATIEEAAILAEMQYHPADSQQAAMAKAAESLVIGELFRQRAAELGIKVKDESKEASDDDFLAALIEREVAIPEADEQACSTYYQQNPERFTTSPLLEVRHVLLAAAPDDELDRVNAKMMAEQIIKQLQEGEDFGQLAQKHSACPSSATAGSLGQVSRGQTVAEFERQVFTADLGLIPNPVETRYGFHVVWVDRKIEGKQLPYEAVKDKIAAYLDEKVERKAVAQYIHTLIQDAEIKGFDFAVSDSPLLQ
ncbi:Foldase protein PrsA 3 [Pseudidiomarina piscicola]|uniref:peptidylprolyl isomerase n=1 Tax=Pseudidiomarina piscicola TaxID=2614830 RepID=A0A6S6WQ98_9GAMM|nr:peptidylprolyl isomerase [Pseudidiomarina piscicola]CAB0151486.1 Foldase protein PrsA 3 [Pseudidiomarina piscicola]VZT40965.1 Foldase protein PrsA 3 [Pseudomonas aeruginosa]